MNDTTTGAKPAVDIDALLAAQGIDSALAEEHITLVDEEEKVAVIATLHAEDKSLAAQEKTVKTRREAIRGLLRQFITPGDSSLVIVSGEQSTVIAKMTYPEPTVRLNTDYIKEHYPIADHPEMYIRTESTPQMRLA